MKPANPPPVLYFNPDFYADGNLCLFLKVFVEQYLRPCKFILRTKARIGVLCLLWFLVKAIEWEGEFFQKPWVLAVYVETSWHKSRFYCFGIFTFFR